MAVCRVEKNKNYTTMSNYHLRDPNLSNKARGLLSTMLSLPEDWDYTTRGLAKIINLLEGSGNDNPGAKSQGMKQLMAGGGVALIGITLVPLLSGLFG